MNGRSADRDGPDAAAARTHGATDRRPASPPGQTVSDPATQPGHPTSPPLRARPHHFVLAFLGPLVLLTLFMIGYGAVDRPDPALGAARSGYLFTFFAAGAGVYWMMREAGRHGTSVLAWSLGLGVAMAVPVASMAQDSYDGFVLLGFLVLYFWYLLGALAVILITGAAKGWANASLAAATAAGATATAFGAAAAYHLVTLERQAELAREAHSTPAAGLVAAALVVLALAAFIRRTG